jgi:hypothetical protein
MAKSDNSLLLHDVRGQMEKQIGVKKYGKNTVISAFRRVLPRIFL